MSRDEIARAVQIANECGLRGQKVDVLIVPPLTASGQTCYVVVPIERSTASAPS